MSRRPDRYANTPVKVCVIDTGYDSLHEDLPKMIDAENNGGGGGSVAVTGTQTGYGDPMTDGDGHGTHVAGVIGALGGNGIGIVGGELGGETKRGIYYIEREMHIFFFISSRKQLWSFIFCALSSPPPARTHTQSTPTQRNSPSTYPRH